MEAGWGVGAAVAKRTRDARHSASRAETGGRDHNQRRDGRSDDESPLDQKTNDCQARPPENRRGDEVGDRSGTPGGQPGRRCHRCGAPQTQRSQEALQGPPLCRGLRGDHSGMRRRLMGRDQAGVRVSGPDCRSNGGGPAGHLGRDRPRKRDMDRARIAHEGWQEAPGPAHGSDAQDSAGGASDLFGGEGLLFPGPRGQVIHSASIYSMLRRQGIQTTLHGFRASFRTWCGDSGQPRELAEAALAHMIPNATEAAYARGTMFERRRRLMAEWADYLAGDT